MWPRGLGVLLIALGGALVSGGCSSDSSTGNKNAASGAIGDPCDINGAGGECPSHVCTVVTCGTQEFGVCAGPDCTEENPCPQGLTCVLLPDKPGRCFAASTLQTCPILVPGSLKVGDACQPTQQGAAQCPYRRCDYILCPDNSQFYVCSGRDCSPASPCPLGQGCLEVAAGMFRCFADQSLASCN